MIFIYLITVFVFVKTKQELLFVMKSTNHCGFQGVTYTVTVSIVKILCFRANRSIKTEEINIRLLNIDQSDRVQPVAISSAHLCQHYSEVAQE